MYRPNFCIECGARVVRERWRVWTSRRFCQSCDRRFRRSRLLVPTALGVGLVVAGFVAGRAGRPAPPPLVVERGTLPLAPVPAAGATTQRAAGEGGDAAARSASPTSSSAPRYGPDGTANERPTDPEEVVSICGARTKKGTPCQRRVRGTGRCWQHRGKPAMLPPSKLIVPG